MFQNLYFVNIFLKIPNKKESFCFVFSGTNSLNVFLKIPLNEFFVTVVLTEYL